MSTSSKLIIYLILAIIIYIIAITCTTSPYSVSYRIIDKWHNMSYIKYEYEILEFNNNKWSEYPTITYIPGQYYVTLELKNGNKYEYKVSERDWNILDIDSLISFKFINNDKLWENQIKTN